MSVVGEWIDAVVDRLETADVLPDLGLAGTWTVHRGELDGKQSTKTACVFEGDWGLAPSVNWARPVLYVRAWLPEHRLPKTQPRDPALLSDLAEAVMAAMQPIQTLPLVDDGRGLYFFPTFTRQDRDDWGVEVRLDGWCRNPGTVAA